MPGPAVLLLAAVLSAAARVAPVEPTEAALRKVQELRASRMGVDRSGNLWAWDRGSGVVEMISPAGESVGRARAGGARSVDADRSWGIVALTEQGRRLVVVAWDGRQAPELTLPGEAGEVTWIDERTVAVSPKTSEHRVEIWNLHQQKRLSTFGDEEPIVPKPGATRLRTVLLEYDERSALLFTLESFTGDLKVYSRDGALVRSTGIAHPDRPRTEAWIERIDEQAKKSGDVQTPGIYLWPSLTVDDQGVAWLAEACRSDGQTAALVKLPRGSPERVILNDLECCSRSLVRWGDHLIFHRESSPGGCSTSTRRML